MVLKLKQHQKQTIEMLKQSIDRLTRLEKLDLSYDSLTSMLFKLFSDSEHEDSTVRGLIDKF